MLPLAVACRPRELYIFSWLERCSSLDLPLVLRLRNLHDIEDREEGTGGTQRGSDAAAAAAAAPVRHGPPGAVKVCLLNWAGALDAKLAGLNSHGAVAALVQLHQVMAVPLCQGPVQVPWGLLHTGRECRTSGRGVGCCTGPSVPATSNQPQAARSTHVPAPTPQVPCTSSPCAPGTQAAARLDTLDAGQGGWLPLDVSHEGLVAGQLVGHHRAGAAPVPARGRRHEEPQHAMLSPGAIRLALRGEKLCGGCRRGEAWGSQES